MNVIFVGNFEEKLNTDIYEKKLKITFMKYLAIHTKNIISHSTTLEYNHNI